MFHQCLPVRGIDNDSVAGRLERALRFVHEGVRQAAVINFAHSDLHVCVDHLVDRAEARSNKGYVADCGYKQLLKLAHSSVDEIVDEIVR